jgi:glycosyltransferase involved in cell wall biosynthesis
LSATFVYHELLAMQALGFTVVPVTVHRPINPAQDQANLARLTKTLYESNAVTHAWHGLRHLPSFGKRAVNSLRLLANDLWSCRRHAGQCAKLLYQYLSAVKLAKIMQLHHCRHLHIHFAHVPAQIGMYASAMTGIPFTVVGHANDLFERPLLLKQKASRTKKFITISEFNIRHLIAAGIPSEKVQLVRCGVAMQDRAADLPVHGRIFRLGSLGRLVAKKGMDILLCAVAMLKDHPIEWELCIAGDGPLRAELEILSSALEIAHRVSFIGALPHREVGTWLQGLDAFVLACQKDGNGDMDGIPVVLMEAMAMNVPVISTRISGIPELVIHERTGLLCAAGDPVELSATISNILNDASLRASLTRDGADHVNTEFSQEVNVKRLSALILG